MTALLWLRCKVGHPQLNPGEWMVEMDPVGDVLVAEPRGLARYDQVFKTYILWLPGPGREVHWCVEEITHFNAVKYLIEDIAEEEGWGNFHVTLASRWKSQGAGHGAVVPQVDRDVDTQLFLDTLAKR